MAKGMIRLCNKKIIDDDSTSEWEKNIFEDTHREFYMQAQEYDPEMNFSSYREMLKDIPRASGIEYLVSTAAVNYIRSVQGSFYGFKDRLEIVTLPIKDFKFELVDSHITDKSKHKIRISLYTDFLIWIDSFDGNILAADLRWLAEFVKGEAVETWLIPLGANTSISFYQSLPDMNSKLN